VRLIIDFDGPLFDVAAACYAAYQQAAGTVGWSRLPQAEFWRLLRTKGREANVLPGSKPQKLKEYLAHYDTASETDACQGLAAARPGVAETLNRLTRKNPAAAVTLGTNVAARRQSLQKAGLTPLFDACEALSPDLRKRPAELRALSGGRQRTVIVAGSDVLVRTARDAELFCVGVAAGPCAVARLHQAGADVVYKSLEELADCFDAGAEDLIRAGLPADVV
jgi:phosphoglycolate phosphatase-like HAD superfamily hydrolase